VGGEGGWINLDIDGGSVSVGTVPIICFRAAVGLLAISDTAFSENMASYVDSKFPKTLIG
jgi:hypothetical protein